MTVDTLLQISVVILLLPLLGFVFNIFFGKRLKKISGVIATGILGIDLILSIIVCIGKLTVFSGENLIQTKLNWIYLGNDFIIRIGVGIDNLASIMLIVVTLISFLVHLFSTEYMAEDIRYSRYFAYLGLFTFSMLGIVIANNFLFMYVFWELVGISSYLLIGFWYEKDSAANAGKKAFIVNRIGDLGFFIGIMIVFFSYGTFMFDEVFGSIKIGSLPFDSSAYLTAAGILIFCGAIGKSAQFPLHVWLPDAMEGPTPVSALIHAATMVAAGVYLVARVFPMLSADALTFIAYTGAITAFISATIAITQVDFKRVLAYSTVSQLGYMIMSLGVGAYTMGFMHLVTHAWFKAALFLASGSVIHAMHHSAHHQHDHSTDVQDINNMGGLRKTMPLTYLTFLFVTMTISGVPFTSGFLSKDGILAGTLAFGQLTGHWLIPVLGFVSAGITAFYMFRLTIVSFHGKPRTKIASHTKENKFVIVFPLVLLAALSLWFFYSPDPTDTNKGWFAKAVVQPETVVPAQYQWDFLLSEKAVASHEEKGIAGMINTAEANAAEVKSPGQTENQAGETADSGEKVIENTGITHSAEGNTAEDKIHEGNHSESEQGEGHHYRNKFAEQMHHTHLPAMLLSLIIAGLGILFAFIVYQFGIFNPDNMAKQFPVLHRISFRKWYFDEIYQATAVGGTMGFAKVLSFFDLKVVDGLVNLTAWFTRAFSVFIGFFDNIVIDGLVNLSANLTGFFGAIFRKFQTGRVQTYLILLLICIVAVLYYFI